MALIFGLTLNPITIALDAEASVTSDSLIPPTPEWIIEILTSSVDSFRSDWFKASTEPLTSAFTTMFNSFTSSSEIFSNKLSRLIFVVWLSLFSLVISAFLSAIAFAVLSSLTA